jgi:CHASE2 domain-containing sensor protein
MAWFILFLIASSLAGILTKKYNSGWIGPIVLLIVSITAIGYFYFRRI